ncbi:IS30 family transposase, partial [Pseudoalteromonas sp. S558]
NEKTNGLIRRYFPKKTDFSTITNEQLQEVVMKINTRPRKILNYQTAEEVFIN